MVPTLAIFKCKHRLTVALLTRQHGAKTCSSKRQPPLHGNLRPFILRMSSTTRQQQRCGFIFCYFFFFFSRKHNVIVCLYVRHLNLGEIFDEMFSPFVLSTLVLEVI